MTQGKFKSRPFGWHLLGPDPLPVTASSQGGPGMKAVLHFLLTLATTFAVHGAPAELGLPPGVVNSKPDARAPLAASEALRRITVPEGFRVTLFASEPEVCQPVAFDFDERGRMWVAECFSYPDYKEPQRDRILVFSEGGPDGRFAERQVFLANGRRLTSLAVGLGGVWVLSLPELLFIPDRDGDGVPDGPAEVHLDGWSLDCKHNMANGLAWGPDGWLYGRHGMQNVSRVGRPGTAADARVPLDCSIWRYHPTRRVFEVVAHGLVNPWGLDWDAHGQAFIGNNVNGHLWHLVPGGVYERTAGAGFRPHAYATLPMCADHLHFAGANWRAGWVASRSATGEHDTLGGGHSHCGGMLYLGTNWPAAFRGGFFLANTHGRRVNHDSLERRGSGYVARHRPDFLRANDAWFRGSALHTGPDGGVFVADWNDFGECHDFDGSFRASGRLYKVTFGQPSPLAPFDLRKAGDAELIVHVRGDNEWFARRARVQLQERAAAQRLAPGTAAELLAQFQLPGPTPRRLRLLWALHAIGHADDALLVRLLDEADEHLRWWAVQLLCEGRQPPAAALAKFTLLARHGSTPHTRLALASALQRMPLAERWALASPLLARAEDAADPNLPVMLWLGIEPAVAADPARAAQLLASCQMPQVRQFIARRLAAP
ncbi:MAG: hypothetical protein B9S33_22195 [Pedosphaera sp. Tous-C6FEB]|nr:MAG: hypothetical protein B9S33_22195 [Pedosphaera sp. Tous-C6FEB]